MNLEYLAILLLVVGGGLIVAEVFIPSGGMILVLCVVSFTASLWCAYKAWWGVSPFYFGTYIASLIIFIPGILFGLYRLLENTRFGDRILLSAPELEDVTPYQEEEAHLAEFIGQRGAAITRMMPGGLVQVNGERLHAFTEGLMIEQGGAVKVIGVRGTRVLVQPADDADFLPPPAADAGEAFIADASEGDPESSPLDFDVSQE